MKNMIWNLVLLVSIPSVYASPGGWFDGWFDLLDSLVGTTPVCTFRRRYYVEYDYDFYHDEDFYTLIITIPAPAAFNAFPPGTYNGDGYKVFVTYPDDPNTVAVTIKYDTKLVVDYTASVYVKVYDDSFSLVTDTNNNVNFFTYNNVDTQSSSSP